MQKRYQVFVSSTYTDLQEERSLVFNTLMKMNHIPAGMELFPALDEEQSQFIKRIIDDSDYYVLIIGGRYGSVTAEGLSYTELEYDYAVNKGIKVVAFIHKNPDDIPLGKSEKNPELRDRLAKFREKAGSGRLVNFWESAADLPGMLALSLSSTITNYPAVGWVRADQLGSTEAVSEVNRLNGVVNELRTSLKVVLDANAVLTAKPRYENLAGLEEKVSVRGTYWMAGEGRKEWSLTLTWGELFAELAPSLVDPPTDTLAKSKFAEVLFNLVKRKRPGASLQYADRIALDIRDFETMRVQFSALGLAKIERSEVIGGGIALFWELTNKGKTLMFDMRTVRNAT